MNYSSVKKKNKPESVFWFGEPEVRMNEILPWVLVMLICEWGFCFPPMNLGDKHYIYNVWVYIYTHTYVYIYIFIRVYKCRYMVGIHGRKTKACHK